MNAQKYIRLFEKVIGRKPSPPEFVRAKASGFDPKQIKAIANGDMKIAESSHQVKEQLGDSDADIKEFSTRGDEALGQDGDKPVEEVPSNRTAKDYVAVFEATTGRKPTIQEMADAKSNGFDIQGISGTNETADTALETDSQAIATTLPKLEKSVDEGESEKAAKTPETSQKVKKSKKRLTILLTCLVILLLFGGIGLSDYLGTSSIFYGTKGLIYKIKASDTDYLEVKDESGLELSNQIKKQFDKDFSSLSLRSNVELDKVDMIKAYAEGNNATILKHQTHLRKLEKDLDQIASEEASEDRFAYEDYKESAKRAYLEKLSKYKALLEEQNKLYLAEVTAGMEQVTKDIEAGNKLFDELEKKQQELAEKEAAAEKEKEELEKQANAKTISNFPISGLPSTITSFTTAKVYKMTASELTCRSSADPKSTGVGSAFEGDEVRFTDFQVSGKLTYGKFVSNATGQDMWISLYNSDEKTFNFVEVSSDSSYSSGKMISE